MDGHIPNKSTRSSTGTGSQRGASYFFRLVLVLLLSRAQSSLFFGTGRPHQGYLQQRRLEDSTCIRIRGGGEGSSSASATTRSLISDMTPTIAEGSTTGSTATGQPEASASHAGNNSDDDNTTRVVFSDVDGTLVHYPDHAARSGNNDDGDGSSFLSSPSMIQLPPSSTGMRGVISSKTIRLAQTLRSEGCVKLVLVSGMRGTTLLKRLPYLPRADAYACDSGGRIFYPVDDVVSRENEYDGPIIKPVAFEGASDRDLVPFGIREDLEWKSMITRTDAAGIHGFDDDVEISKKRGLLWDFARTLMSDGFVVDYKGYSTCFRVNRRQQSDDIDDAKFASLLTLDPPDGISASINLGCADFYPSKSGKKNCCQYLVQKFAPHTGTLSKSAVCICDDDNDLEMALAAKHAFIPSVTSDSMAKAIATNPGKFTVTEDNASSIIETAATEVALSSILEMLSRE